MLFAKHLLEQQIGTLAFGPWHASRYATVYIYSVHANIQTVANCNVPVKVSYIASYMILFKGSVF
jgi:hypothetical protein